MYDNLSLELFNLNFKKKISLTNSSLPLFLTLASEKFKNVAYFVKNNELITNIKRQIKSINPNIEVVTFPEIDCPFFSNVSPTKEIIWERIKTLFQITDPVQKNMVCLLSYKSFVAKTICPSELNKRKITIETNKGNSYGRILEFLKNNMYERVDFVKNKGEFAIRGDIMDVFSPNEDLPVRIVFYLDKLESLSNYDPFEQTSTKFINKYNLFAPSEILFNEKSIKRFRELYRKLNICNKEEYYKAISNNVILPGSEQFYPIIYENYQTILEYLKDFTLFFDADYENIVNETYEFLINEIDGFKDFFRSKSTFFLKKKDFDGFLKKANFFLISNSLLESDSKVVFSNNEILKNNKNHNLSEICNSIMSTQNRKYIFCMDSRINEKKLIQIFKKKNINYLILNNLNEKKILDNQQKVYISNFKIEKSFSVKILKDKSLKFLSDSDFFEKITQKNTRKEFSQDNIIDQFSQLNINDFIVHINHGVGKFIGLKKKIINEIEQEFIEISYFNDDKLLIPIENLELISKFGQNDQNVKLDRLGLQNWQLRKASIKKKIKDIATDLAKTAAERQLKKADILISKTLEYEKFSSEFEFTETSDQLKAINQIEQDLSSGKPMDRLICGDVGFGKTEIAMRAAFIAISAGYQVAMICPKLLLVNQHFKTFMKRFSKFDYNIEKISRFESLSRKKEIKKNIKIGFINILIGTHAILAKDIEFENLGLIIIDEEQSFGVEQKENLKKLKPNSHILTMSATPIPRTLQSSLFKIKDISLIKTPPLNRLNVKTFLTIYEENSIKKIILDEIKRNGQVFYVSPRISNLEGIAKRLSKIVPSENFSIIHGRLKSSEIERIYEKFFSKEIKILISTAMIESGLDISNVNTIIVEKPYLFGLSQLYQLRGRVGRSNIQAFAYLILDKIDSLNEENLRKLQIISKINHLGAGFSIAANDLDIRGAGNLIGSEQSGHIREVGIELYYKMVNEAIDEIQYNKKNETDWSPRINLGFSINIPENYIQSLDLRLNIYRKIANVKNSEELNVIFDNLRDRFGKLPNSLNNLFKIIEIKILSKKLQIKKVDYSKKGFVLEFKGERIKNVDKFIELAKLNPDKIKLMPNSKLMYFTKKQSKIENINELKNFLDLLGKD